MWLELSLQGLPAYERLICSKSSVNAAILPEYTSKVKVRNTMLFNGNTSIEHLTSSISYWIPIEVFSFHKLYIAISYDAHLMATILG